MATTSVSHPTFIVYILRRSDKVDPYDAEKPAPFYVGKGKPNRPSNHFWGARETTRSTRRFNIIRAVERQGGVITVDIVASGLSEPVAFMLERQLIHFYGRDDQDGILANRTDGGEGPTGMALESRQRIAESKRGIPRSPETIEKLRKSRVGFRHTEATRQKIALLGIGRKLSPESRAKLSRSIQAAVLRGRKPVDWTPERRARVSAWATGRKYPEMGMRNRGGGNPVARGFWVEDYLYSSVKEAATALGVDRSMLYDRIKRGDPRYRYEEGTEALGAKLSETNPWARRVRVNGIEYVTVEEALRVLAVAKTTFYRGIRKGLYQVEYPDALPGKLRSVKQPVRVNGVAYASVGHAIEALGIGETTFYRHGHAGKYVVEPIESQKG